MGDSSLLAGGPQVLNQLVLQNESLLKELETPLEGEGTGLGFVQMLFPGSLHSHHSSEDLSSPLDSPSLKLVQLIPLPLGGHLQISTHDSQQAPAGSLAGTA